MKGFSHCVKTSTWKVLGNLIIDTRDEAKGQSRIDIKALTISGEFQIIKDQTKKDLIHAKFLGKHPHL